jgi:hypothetical protein
MKTQSVTQLNTTINNSKDTDKIDIVFTYCATDEAQVQLIGSLDDAIINNATLYKVDVGITPPIFAIQYLPAVTIFKSGIKTGEFAIAVGVEVSSLFSTLNSNVNTANMSSSPILIGKVGDKEGANQ